MCQQECKPHPTFFFPDQISKEPNPKSGLVIQVRKRRIPFQGNPNLQGKRAAAHSDGTGISSKKKRGNWQIHLGASTNPRRVHEQGTNQDVSHIIMLSVSHRICLFGSFIIRLLSRRHGDGNAATVHRPCPFFEVAEPKLDGASTKPWIASIHR